MVIATLAPDSLTMNVQAVARIVLFSPMDVVFGHVPKKPSTSTIPRIHARLAMRVARAALMLVLVIVWHVRILLMFCKMEGVHRGNRVN